VEIFGGRIFRISIHTSIRLSVASPQPIVSGIVCRRGVGFSNPTQWASGLSTAIRPRRKIAAFYCYFFAQPRRTNCRTYGAWFNARKISFV